MSWFNIDNIKGNLSSVASNVSSFTKEVLQDAVTESFEDIHTESEYQQNTPAAVGAYEQPPTDPYQHIQYLQHEIQNLNNEISFKDEQIVFLQSENESFRQNENHCENLKDVLLEKEKEIELFAQKVQENEILYQEQIRKLEERNAELEAKCNEVHNKSDDNIDTGWTDDWGLSNEAAQDLTFKNECLANDLALKEIIISSIENKIFEISNKKVEASNFNDWIDGIFNEKEKKNSLISDDSHTHSTELCSVLDKYIVKPADLPSEDYAYHIDERLGQIIEEYVKFENENNEYRNIISNIEQSISESGEGHVNFKIKDFKEWLDNVNAQENYIFYNDSSKELLEKIQTEIRDIDEEYEDFKIENFSSWLEKMQCRIDDLEMEIINEQESRDAEEKQRIVERETLNDLFNQKLNEISLLKVELYNYKTQSSHSLNPIVEMEEKELMTVHEQLNEATARCEALQTELASSQKQPGDTSEFELRIKELSTDNDRLRSQLSNVESSNESMETELEDLQQKYDDLYEGKGKKDEELQKLQLQVENLSAIYDCVKEQLVTSESSKESIQVELDEYKVKYNLISSEVQTLQTDLKEATNRYELLQAAETVSDSLQLQLNDLNADKEQLKEQLVSSESNLSNLSTELSELKIKYDAKCFEVDELSDSCEQLKTQIDIMNSDSNTLKNEKVELSAQIDHISKENNESMDRCKNAENELQEIKTEYNLLKLVQLQSEEEKERLNQHSTTLSEANTNLSSQNDQITADMSTMMGDMTLMGTLLHNMASGNFQYNNVDISLKRDQSLEIFNSIQALAEQYTSLETRYNDIKEKCVETNQKDSQTMGEQEDLHNIIVYITNCVDDILPDDMKGGMVVDDKLSSIELSAYVSHMKCLADHINAVEGTLKQNIDDVTKLLEIETCDKNKYLSQIDILNLSIENYKKSIEEKCESEQLCKQANNDLDNLLQLERDTNEKRCVEIEQLNQTISECKNEIEQLKVAKKQTGNKDGGAESGGMKFGAIKRKIKDLELANENLIKENEALKSGTGAGGNVGGVALADDIKQLQSMLNDKTQECECYAEECKLLKSSLVEMQESMASYSSNSVTSLQHQEQLHNLSLMLTEKNEAIEKFEQENEHLKAKLLEVENEISDLELIREECKQLKAMLVGKEHQNKVDDTITTLQSESKQLKQLLAAKDSEVQYMQSQIMEKENELSNMELIQEECKQLKQMLMTKGENSENTLNIDNAELEAKNAEIIELRNSTSDMELLREECKQLKQMLLSNTDVTKQPPSNDNSSSDVSIQLLEAMLEDRDVQIAQQNSVIAELQSKTSDMNLIQEECKMLKRMLADNNQEESVMVNSPSSDVTLNSTAEELVESSFVLQVKQLEEFLKEKEEGLKEKEREVEILHAKIRDAENGLSDLDLIRNECKMLKDMLKEKEEYFIEIQDDLDNANTALQQKNNELKTKETMNGELEQRYKTALDNKDVEIQRLQEEVSISVEQDENLHILQTEYRNVDENLKMTQTELYEVKQLLERTDNELMRTKDECARLKVSAEQSSQLNVSLVQKDEEVLNTKKDIESLQSENASLIKMCDDKESSIKGMEEQCSNLDKKLKENMDLAASLREEIAASETTISRNTTTISNQLNEINKLSAQLEEGIAQNVNLQATLTENGNIMKGKEEEINKLQIMIHNFVNETKDKTNRISQLETELSRSKEYQLQLVENIKSYSDKEKETVTCKTCEYNDNEQKMMKTILENIEKMLQISGQQIQIEDRTHSIIEQLSFVEACLQNILAKISEKELEISNLNNTQNEMKLKYEEELNEKLSQLHICMKELEDKKTESVSVKSSHDLQMKDLQSRLVESSEMGILYEKKCAEYILLQDELFREQKKYKEHKAEFERVGNSKRSEEMEVLRTEMERNAHLYLDKSKECDSLKLEMLQLEETIYTLKTNVETLKVYETSAKQIPGLQQNIVEKVEEINQLKSLLEDNELKLQGSKKEKEFLDGLVKEKEHSDKEKEQLRFQLEQNDRLIQEKEVVIRHKDVTIREMEAKTKRELERLRNHMLMTEEAHTKDIIELQEKEEALQEELEDAKQGLSKKAIILQDSNKQFQEHCVDLEEQLHKISSQRDSSILELSRCQEQIAEDATSIYNLQNALEQLEKEKTEQSEYLTSFAKRKAIEYESRIDELTEELNKTQGAMSEAALAVQGINKLNLELQQKENELKVSKEKMNELLIHVRQLEDEHEKILEAADHKLDKSLLRNLFMKYFQSPNDKRSDILHVIGGLLGWSPQEIQQIGSGAAPSKVGGWITSVWSYGTPTKTASSPPKTSTTPTVYDSNKSLSELFVKFLENETANNTPVDTTSLTLSNDTAPTVPMFVTPQNTTTPDILAFHNNGPDQRIPAPGQEIPRVHTHHAQSTLKSILTAGPY